MTLEHLMKTYTSGSIRCISGQGGLPCLDIKTSLAEARVYLNGASVTHFQPAGEKPVLFLSEGSIYEAGVPIRGGVPICWPWFGAKADNPTAPAHGVARVQQWTVSSISELPSGEIGIVLELLPSDLSRKFWPHSFHLEFRLRIGRELSMTLVTRNTGTEPFAITEALHTYFAVSDVREVQLTGMGHTVFRDKTRGMQRFEGHAEPLTFAAQTDRVYLDTDATATILDPALGRKIIVSKSGSKSTVVWNPWDKVVAALSDFGNDEWSRMLCVETANAADNAVSVASNSNHLMQAVIKVEAL